MLKHETHKREKLLSAHPFAVGLATFITVGLMAVGGEQLTRPNLKVFHIETDRAPVLDGDLSDIAWSSAKSAKVMTTQGGDFGGSHQTEVEVQAVHDGEFAYFSFTWSDPTRSLKHMPLVKTDGQWRVLTSNEDSTDEGRYYEDKFAVLMARGGIPLIGAAIHLSKAPLDGKPAGTTGRGLHFTTDGSVADVWQWRASHVGPDGYIENDHFGPAKEIEPEDREGKRRYAGGFASDDDVIPHRANLIQIDDKDNGTALPVRLPKNYQKMADAMGRITERSDISESETARWWMTISESVPYSKQADKSIPDNTIIPGVISEDKIAPNRSSVRGSARWAAGRWTLEIARRLYTGNEYDVPIKSGALLWVAAFDHADKRHTRHLRPFTLEVE